MEWVSVVFLRSCNSRVATNEGIASDALRLFHCQSFSIADLYVYTSMIFKLIHTHIKHMLASAKAKRILFRHRLSLSFTRISCSQEEVAPCG